MDAGHGRHKITSQITHRVANRARDISILSRSRAKQSDGMDGSESRALQAVRSTAAARFVRSAYPRRSAVESAFRLPRPHRREFFSHQSRNALRQRQDAVPRPDVLEML